MSHKRKACGKDCFPDEVIKVCKDKQLDSSCSACKKLVFASKDVTLTLPKHPATGEAFVIVADGGDVILQGGCNPIEGGDESNSIFIENGNSQEVIFAPSGQWVHNSDLCTTITQSAWFIDPVAGKDSASGKTAAQALKTHAQLACRLKFALILPPAVAGIRTMTITLLNSLPTSDPVGLQVTLGPDVIILYKSDTAVVTGTGTFTAVSAPVVAPQGATAPYILTDASRSVWPLFARLRITSGPRAGAISYVAEDFGGGVAATLDWAIPNPAPFSGVTPVLPQVGDAYAIESLTKFTFSSDWQLGHTGNSQVLTDAPFFGGPAYLAFDNLEAESTPGAAMDFFGIEFAMQLTFTKCRIQPRAAFGITVLNLVSTALLNGAVFGLNTITLFDSGGAFRAEAAGGPSAGSNPLSPNVHHSGGALDILGFSGSPPGCYGGPMWHVGPGAGTMAAAFASTFKSVTDTDGHPGCGFMALGPGSQVQVLGIFFGGGNAVKGVYVSAQSNVNLVGFAAITLTGPVTSLVPGAPTDDFALGEIASLFIPLKSTMSTTINGAVSPPAAPVYTPYVNNSWASLATPVAAGGFGGHAIDPYTDARIITTSSFS